MVHLGVSIVALVAFLLAAVFMGNTAYGTDAIAAATTCDVTKLAETCKAAPYAWGEKVRDMDVFFIEAKESGCFMADELVTAEKMNRLCKVKAEVEMDKVSDVQVQEEMDK